jgi:CBS-domain-containing membrane protein
MAVGQRTSPEPAVATHLTALARAGGVALGLSFVIGVRHGRCLVLCAVQAFVSLGMRHLVVVDAQNCVVGMITRKDLDHAAGHGWWRMSAQAPKPNRRPPSRGKAINK